MKSNSFFPMQPKNDVAYLGTTDSEISSELRLSIFPRRVKFSYLSDFVPVEFRASIMQASVIALKQSKDFSKNAIGMERIFRTRYAFKVINAIIGLISVFVIDFVSFWNISTRAKINKSVDKKACALTSANADIPHSTTRAYKAFILTGEDGALLNINNVFATLDGFKKLTFL